MSAAVPAEPAAAEQKGIAAVRIEIDRRRRVVDLGIARRFANCSRTSLLNRTRIDSGGGGNGCCADRYSGSSRTQQRCQVTQFHSHGVTPWIVGVVCSCSRVALYRGHVVTADAHLQGRQRESGSTRQHALGSNGFRPTNRHATMAEAMCAYTAFAIVIDRLVVPAPVPHVPWVPAPAVVIAVESTAIAATVIVAAVEAAAAAAVEAGRDNLARHRRGRVGQLRGR